MSGFFVGDPIIGVLALNKPESKMCGSVEPHAALIASPYPIAIVPNAMLLVVVWMVCMCAIIMLTNVEISSCNFIGATSAKAGSSGAKTRQGGLSTISPGRLFTLYSLHRLH